MTAPPPDLDALKALAEKATPGPWFLIQTPSYLGGQQWADGKSRASDPITIGSAAHTEEIATVWTYLLPTEANASLIAACHPQAILSWIAHTEKQDARIRELEGALQSLVEKLDLISANPQFIGVFQMAAIHNMPYSGPNYEAELKAARAALSTGPEGK